MICDLGNIRKVPKTKLPQIWHNSLRDKGSLALVIISPSDSRYLEVWVLVTVCFGTRFQPSL